MGKLPSVSIDERRFTRKRRAVTYAIFLLLLISSPILYESTLLVIGNWQSFFGAVPTIRTPVLDALSEAYQTSSFDVKHWARGAVTTTVWKSSYVIPFAIFWTFVLAMLLRRG